MFNIPSNIYLQRIRLNKLSITFYINKIHLRYTIHNVNRLQLKLDVNRNVWIGVRTCRYYLCAFWGASHLYVPLTLLIEADPLKVVGLHKPKSEILSWTALESDGKEIRMFSGLMSRWMKLLLWMCNRPLAIWRKASWSRGIDPGYLRSQKSLIVPAHSSRMKLLKQTKKLLVSLTKQKELIVLEMHFLVYPQQLDDIWMI